MKQEMLKQFDQLMGHLNSEENGMAEEFRETLEKALTTKTMWLIAGGTDGYTSIEFFGDEEEAQAAIDGDEESYSGMDSGPTGIEVPSWMYN